ncbi:hypothetical protein K466DRAFT_571152 [Polyporus arcularius HHB13444]|uniref:Uncharacterized protein n=1 Tax=Polyporus arcularius HHB13444 TaxID=1314778 RepID=A0A5C3NML8_9APHY|nr:hypothetical protein K466DRAFT_571152 [Polyporus arcularius HHB13444]
MPTSIADELESFLHVLVYGCIRRVRSSLESIEEIQEFIHAYFAGGSYDPKYKQASCPVAKRDSVVVGQTLTFTTRPVVFSTPDGKIAQDHPLNKLIAKLLAVFHSRYVVDTWESAQKKSSSPELQQSPPTPKTKPPTIWETGLEGPEATFGEAPDCETETAPQSIEPTPEQRKNMAALQSHSLIAHILHSYFSSGDYKWPEDDVVPDPQAESSTKKPPRRTSAAAGTLKHGVVPVPQADDPEDVPMPDAEENDKLEGGSARTFSQPHPSLRTS